MENKIFILELILKHKLRKDKREKDRKKPPIIHFQRDIPFPDEAPPIKESFKKNH
jgi:hypothetical protein